MSKQKKILTGILAVCIIAVAFFATLLIRELIIDDRSRSFYEDLAAGVERRPDNTNSNGTSTDGTQPGQSGDANVWEPYLNFYAFEQLIPGIVGWIKLDGTPIDYPVMQYTDNDFFLTRLPDGTEHRNGSIFLDYRNNSDFSDKSILIYGHATGTGDMFGVFKNYRDQDFYEANPVINLYTPERDYKIVLFAGHVAHSVRDHPPPHFESDEEFLAYIDHLKSISVFDSTTEVTATDRIISLVTCTYDFNDARLILVGILIDT